jgi:diaminohydroxyphosphoribosylaminopyrimidine deaminase/5-amino-6-(5-phosphoribosylamino)uracil reductase
MPPTPTQHETYMRRAFQLARLGAGTVAPNPMVGAVIVHEGRIIGEGWHRQYGRAHAEVNAVASVRPEDRCLLVASTLYVSLEPCCIHGNTPPCTDLVIREGIPRVVLSCTDDTPGVDGLGVRKLREAGVEVIEGILLSEGRWLARRRNVFVREKRPYVMLKWAQSADGHIGRSGERVWLTGPLAQRLSHRWRTEEAAILVGAKTMTADDPALTARLWPGRSPLRIGLDLNGRSSEKLRFFDGSAPTLLVTGQTRPELPGHVGQYVWEKGRPFSWALFLERLAVEHKVQSLIVEGGSSTIESLVSEGLWDEARVFTAPVALGSGILAPRLYGGILLGSAAVGPDRLEIWKNGDREF